MTLNIPLAVAMIICGTMLGEAIVLIWQLTRKEKQNGPRGVNSGPEGRS